MEPEESHGRRVVRGDPAHPLTRGSLCAEVNDDQRRVHHPDRVLRPVLLNAAVEPAGPAAPTNTIASP